MNLLSSQRESIIIKVGMPSGVHCYIDKAAKNIPRLTGYYPKICTTIPFASLCPSVLYYSLFSPCGWYIIRAFSGLSIAVHLLITPHYCHSRSFYSWFLLLSSEPFITAFDPTDPATRSSLCLSNNQSWCRRSSCVPGQAPATPPLHFSSYFSCTSYTARFP